MSAGGYTLAQDADALCLDFLCVALCFCAVLYCPHQTQGMEYLHAKNIVHFDLKTANLLVGMRVSEAVSWQEGLTFTKGVGGLTVTQGAGAQEEELHRRSRILLWLCVPCSLVCLWCVPAQDKTPICKVADFGLSKQKQQTYVTGVATLRGTLPW